MSFIFLDMSLIFLDMSLIFLDMSLIFSIMIDFFISMKLKKVLMYFRNFEFIYLTMQEFLCNKKLMTLKSFITLRSLIL